MFNYLFDGYNYPFITSDEEISKWPESKQFSYFTDASRLLDSNVFQQETDEMRRHFYRELAMRSVNGEAQVLNMGAMMGIEALINRINHLSKLHRDSDVEDL